MKLKETDNKGVERLLPKEKEIAKIKELTVAPVKAETAGNETEKMKNLYTALGNRLEHQKEAKQAAAEIKKPVTGKRIDTNENDDVVKRMNNGEDVSFKGMSLSRCEKACAKKADGKKNTYVLGHW